MLAQMPKISTLTDPVRRETLLKKVSLLRGKREAMYCPDLPPDEQENPTSGRITVQWIRILAADDSEMTIPYVEWVASANFRKKSFEYETTFADNYTIAICGDLLRASDNFWGDP